MFNIEIVRIIVRKLYLPVGIKSVQHMYFQCEII